jgi:hypothetical protein
MLQSHFFLHSQIHSHLRVTQITGKTFAFHRRYAELLSVTQIFYASERIEERLREKIEKSRIDNKWEFPGPKIPLNKYLIYKFMKTKMYHWNWCSEANFDTKKEFLV